MRFHLHEEMHVFFIKAVTAFGIRVKTPRGRTGYNRSVVGIGNDGLAGMELVCIAYHRKQRHVLLDAVDHPIRIENLVAAMFGIGLREHHQLDICGVAAHTGEIFQQIVDLVDRQCQPHRGIGSFKCSPAPADDIHCAQGCRLALVIKTLCSARLAEYHLGHAIVYQRFKHLHFCIRQRCAICRGHIIGNPAFQPVD